MRPAIEMIRHLFSEGAKPFKRAEVITRFADDEEAEDLLEGVLGLLTRFKLLKRVPGTRLAVNFLNDTVVGRLSITRKGTGYVRPVERPDREAIAIPGVGIGAALPGDIVIAKADRRRRRGKKVSLSGRILAIAARAKDEMVGLYQKRGRLQYVVPDEHAETAVIHVTGLEVDHVQRDDKVVVRLIHPFEHEGRCEGVIVKVLGRAGAAGVDVLAVMHEFDLPGPFGAAVAAEMERFAGIVSPRAGADRMDFRDRLLVTIDPKDAKDFDDAIGVRRVGRGFEVAVHIADVAHYVAPGSATDREARRRGTSAYLPTGVIPMLPLRLSADLASLCEGRDRLTKSVIVHFDGRLEIKSFKVVNSVIRSTKRLTYEHAQRLLDADVQKAPPRERSIAAMLHDVCRITRKLRADRFSKGSLELDLPEIRVELNAEGAVVGVSQRQHTESHSLVEELMLMANRLVARFFEERRLPLMRRIHEPPDPEKLQDFAVFARSLGFSLGDPRNRGEIAKVLAEADGTSLQHAVHYGLLRSLSHARYSGEREGHYALAFPNYCHFTSPIRRYPDLFVHQILDVTLAGRKTPRRFQTELEQVADQASGLEVRAERAERALTEVLVLRYLQDKIGEAFNGVITGVEDYGLFVELIDIGIDGLLPRRLLPSDRWEYDPASRRLTGVRSATTYHLGQKLSVVVQAINVERRFLDLALGESPAGKRPARRRRR